MTNQMTTMLTGTDRLLQQVPALGETWAHVPTQRLILYWHDHQRRAILYKSASVRQTDVCFQITVSINPSDSHSCLRLTELLQGYTVTASLDDEVRV